MNTRRQRPALTPADVRISVRCDVCGHWLVSPTSVEQRRGPKCAAQQGDSRG